MKKQIVVIDDDPFLVQELRDHLEALQRAIPRDEIYAGLKLVAPPEFLLDLRGVREKIQEASVVVLDLNIGGSGNAGEALLKRFRKYIRRSSTPLIVWSKYLESTFLFETGIILQGEAGEVAELKFSEIKSLKDRASKDYPRIQHIKRIYPQVCAFVSKASRAPSQQLLQVIKRVLAVADGAAEAPKMVRESPPASRE